MRSCKRNDHESYSLLEDLASCNLVDWYAHTTYYGDGDVVTSQKTGTFENSMESLGTDYSSDSIILLKGPFKNIRDCNGHGHRGEGLEIRSLLLVF